MNGLHTILYFFFLLCLNNSCLLLTCKYIKKMNLMMKKTKNVDNTFIYSPKSTNQESYVEYLLDEKVDLIIAVGPAGTGKTLFACLKAVSQLKNGNIRKLILTRPVVTVEEDIGFLPGNINKKMDPWTKPIFDLFLEFFSKTELDNFIHNNIIEISPLAFMRGRTFKNSFIIADEMQNSSPNQMKMLTTRIGTNSKMVITGDLNQTDIPSKNGLEDLINRINKYNLKNNNTLNNSIKIINFEKEDIERSDIVKHIINLYDYDDTVVNNKNNSKTNITILNNRNVTTVMNNTTNITTSTNLNTNAIKLKHFNDNDAALIPKHHMTKNTDIFYDNSNF